MRSHGQTVASSVDAERAFSGGRLQVNHLQHGMSSQTFKAQIAIGLWIGPPIFPSINPFISIIEGKMSRKKKVGSKKGKEPESDTDDCEESISTSE